MKSLFLKQFAFEHWSNSLILENLQSISNPPERPVVLLSHIISSHCMWLNRVTKTEMICTLFQERTLEECKKQMDENLTGWIAFLESTSEDAFSNEIEFMAAWEANPSKRKISLQDALIHLINHSSYHRGQIVSQIKGLLEPLPLTNYIMYSSEII
ncbi:MAG: DinB family protein [Flavobacteriaceae bacterium]